MQRRDERKSETAEIIKARIKTLGLKPEQVAKRIGMAKATLEKHLAGRKLSDKYADKLSEVLFTDPIARLKQDPVLQERFAKCVSTSPPKEVTESPVHDPLELRVCTLTYSPFSGADDAFVDSFIRRLCDLSVWRFVESLPPRTQTDAATFDIEERISWVTSGHADVLIQLCSLTRMRRLQFLLTPIRVSVNAIVLRDEEEHLESIKNLLCKSAKNIPLTLCGIQHEVGYTYLTQSLKISQDAIKTFHTLDASRLAEEFLALKGERPMLICDEITCMSVLRELGDEAMLVLQPSTDDAVLQSNKRRSMPAHPFGIATTRNRNSDMFEVLRDSLGVFLAYETETVATMFEDLYVELVKQVRSCLEQDGALYVAGVRRVPVEQLGEYRMTLADQNARAYARRCLQVSRASLRNLPPQIRAWEPALRRAQERILNRESADRTRVRASVLAALKNVLGLDPLQALKPIPSRLVVWDGGVSPELKKNWSAFQYILEHDLDVEISLADSPWERGYTTLTLETLVSDIQHSLESSGQRSSVTYVAPWRPEDRGKFAKLWERYLAEAHRPNSSSRKQLEDTDPEAVANEKKPVFLAVNLGQLVGFVATKPVQGPATAGHEGGLSLRVEHVYLPDYMRDSGTSRRLLRAAIEHADKEGLEAVLLDTSSKWIGAEKRRLKLADIFRRCGFVEGGKNTLEYRIQRFAAPRDLQG